MLVLVLVLVLVLGLVVPGLGKDSGKLVHGGEKKQGVGWIGSWGAALRVRFNYNHWLATSSTIKHNNRVGMKSNWMECWRSPCWRCSWLCFSLFLKRTSSIYIDSPLCERWSLDTCSGLEILQQDTVDSYSGHSERARAVQIAGKSGKLHSTVRRTGRGGPDGGDLWEMQFFHRALTILDLITFVFLPWHKVFTTCWMQVYCLFICTPRINQIVIESTNRLQK